MRIVLSFATRIEWHEGYQIARAIRTLGHDLRIVDTRDGGNHWNHDVELFAADAELDDVAGSDTDLYLYIEPRGLLPRGLERATSRTVCALSDTALSLAPRHDLAQLFDDVLLYHPDALGAFTDHPPERVRWMPVAIDPVVFADRGRDRDLEVAFTGSMHDIWADRRAALDALQARYRVNDFSRRHSLDQVAELYNRARIVFNWPIANALNPRIFEAMGCGALLVTRRADNRLEEFFVDGEHLVVFEDERDLLDKVAYYLAHDGERKRLASAGYDRVHAAHTYQVRLGTVLSELPTRPPHVAPARWLSKDRVDDIYQRRHKQAGQAAALMRLAARQQEHSFGRYRTLARAATTYFRRLQGAWDEGGV